MSKERTMSDNNNRSLDKKTIKEYNKQRKYGMRKYLCHAPFKSLTFFLDGDIFACWYNKQYLLGKYPNNNIKEIWFGEKAKKLRYHIQNNDLSCGCDECKRHFTDNNFHSTGALQYDRLNEKAKQYPISLDFQISNVCNLECIMCHGEYSSSIRQNREKKPPYQNPYDENFVKQLEEFIPHLKKASFTGGEVFLTKIYYEIWEKIYQINPNTLISITTNGTILNLKAKQILDKMRFNITLSIDSIKKESYETIRKNADYTKVIENLDFFVQYTQNKKTSLSARICPMKQNWHELPELYQYLNKRNVRMYFNTVMFPSYCSLWNLKPAKLKEVIDYLSGFSFKSSSKIQKNNRISYRNLITQLKKWQKASVEREKKFTEINLYDSDKLQKLLKEKIEEFLNHSEIFNIKEKTRFLDFFDKVMLACKKEITNKKQLKNALVNYLGFPVNRLIDEFKIRSIEKLTDLTKQTGQEKH